MEDSPQVALLVSHDEFEITIALTSDDSASLPDALTRQMHVYTKFEDSPPVALLVSHDYSDTKNTLPRTPSLRNVRCAANQITSSYITVCPSTTLLVVLALVSHLDFKFTSIPHFPTPHLCEKN